MAENVSRDKESWIDIVKWIACMLVLLGHFFQSMVKSGIMEAGILWQWFDHTVYLFHVPLFFICSGYLYQRNSVVETRNAWKDNVLRKAVNLGVPYAAFSAASFLLKEVFQGTVNEENSSNFLRTLFLEPLSPYWYLYILFFLFLVTPTFKSKKQAFISLAVSLFIFFFQQNPLVKEVYFVQGVARREIWFIIGMLLCFCKNEIKFDVRYLAVSFLLFPFTIMGYNKEMELLPWMLYCLTAGICGCLLVLEISFLLNDKVPEKAIRFSRKNTLPVFLMHTIFAAGIRSILCKMGITSLAVHVIFGISGSIFFPVIAAEIMRKFPWMYFFIQPDLRRKDRSQ